MIRLLVVTRLQGDLGTGTVPTSLWAAGAAANAHVAATKVDAAIKRIANALALSVGERRPDITALPDQWVGLREPNPSVYQAK